MNKTILVVGSLALFSSVALADPVVPQPIAQSEITLKITPDELNTIGEGLQNVPFGKAAPLISKLRQQYLDQQPKPEQKPAIKQPEKENAPAHTK